MTRLHTFAAAAILATAGTASLSTSALADAKVYQAASVCRGPFTLSLSAGTVFNVSNINPLFAYCSINRDRTDAAPTSVQVTVVDNSSVLLGDGNFTCNLTAYNKAGAAGASGASLSTSGTNSAGTTLNLPIPATPADGTLTLKCKIPRRGVGDPSSHLASIKVIEPDPGN